MTGRVFRESTWSAILHPSPTSPPHRIGTFVCADPTRSDSHFQQLVVFEACSVVVGLTVCRSAASGAKHYLSNLPHPHARLGGCGGLSGIFGLLHFQSPVLIVPPNNETCMLLMADPGKICTFVCIAAEDHRL